MVNQITSNITQLRAIGETGQAQTGKAQSSSLSNPPARGGETGDDVSLSVSARSLPLEMSKGPPIDADVVAHLSAEIAAGRYPLNPARIADALAAQVSLIAD
ncbi:MAG: flagellar biosynthesis anti-sigma factor FlgM [Natronohydrobacter sp.]|nr:flagellar biosynthesis anti-sigma factor FlgM [Natronohydrobacter sp.]